MEIDPSELTPVDYTEVALDKEVLLTNDETRDATAKEVKAARELLEHAVLALGAHVATLTDKDLAEMFLGKMYPKLSKMPERRSRAEMCKCQCQWKSQMIETKRIAGLFAL
mmetsp:Transcript_7557/g.12590  ORF Transcript_7557/g.12590 Transcript_7557/m.12590 type:complete len:111 (+) Transcript_7557:1264-1596(+)